MGTLFELPALRAVMRPPVSLSLLLLCVAVQPITVVAVANTTEVRLQNMRTC